jgi:hypothetical protein
MALGSMASALGSMALALLVLPRLDHREKT